MIFFFRKGVCLQIKHAHQDSTLNWQTMLYIFWPVDPMTHTACACPHSGGRFLCFRVWTSDGFLVRFFRRPATPSPPPLDTPNASREGPAVAVSRDATQNEGRGATPHPGGRRPSPGNRRRLPRPAGGVHRPALPSLTPHPNPSPHPPLTRGGGVPTVST